MKCVHLDFHTSPDIDNIGCEFDKAEFTKTLKDAKVDLITVFAKCHHGYSYYPTKLGTVSPGLKFNLLKEQIEAVHDAGAKAPIYITMGWSKKDADEHPEWHHVDFWSKKPLAFGYNGGRLDEPLDAPLADCSWMTLCPVGEYKKYLEAITREICEQFDVSDGVFYDICCMRDACVCESCKAGMRAQGLDPDKYEDARKYYIEKRIELMKDLTGIVHEYAKDATVFYNSGGADMNRPEFHPYQTHYELEDLPTAWGGYDVMPIRAKYFERYGKLFLGMTGKFHHAWGEFGGFKNKDALKYECADMLSVGASISVGDHLHPYGRLDKSTYSVIGYAFDYVSKIEKYCENTKAYTDIALWMSHTNSDLGCSKALQIMHLEFDVIDDGANLDKYKCIILPDYVKLSDNDKKSICDFVENGGKVIASGESIFDELGIILKGKNGADLDFISCDLDEITTPFLSYSSAYVTESDGQVLADVYEPFFNRTYGHFCGHKNTPPKPDKASYPALVKKGNVLYFAHPIFDAYNNSGSYALERFIKKGFDAIYEKKLSVEGFPSCGRVRFRKSERDNFFALHLLYAPPVNRGNVCLLADFPILNDLKITVDVDEKIKSIRLAPEGKKIKFTQKGSEVSLKLDNMQLHNLLILEF